MPVTLEWLLPPYLRFLWHYIYKYNQCNCSIYGHPHNLYESWPVELYYYSNFALQIHIVLEQVKVTNCVPK